jgi:hypothetical protein
MMGIAEVKRSRVLSLLALSALFPLYGCSKPDAKVQDAGGLSDARGPDVADAVVDSPLPKDVVVGDSAMPDSSAETANITFVDAPDAAPPGADSAVDRGGPPVDAPDAALPDVPPVTGIDAIDASRDALPDVPLETNTDLIDASSDPPPDQSRYPAIFGGTWTSGGADGGGGNFEISSGAKGLHAYAQISPARTSAYVLLANIPDGTGWFFQGQCTANSATATTCDTKDGFISIGTGDASLKIPTYFGGYFPSGVSESVDGSLIFSAPAGVNLAFDGPDPQVSSRMVLTYDSLSVGSTMTVDIEGTSQSGKSVLGRLQGQLVSIRGVTGTTETTSAGVRIREISTAPRP